MLYSFRYRRVPRRRRYDVSMEHWYSRRILFHSSMQTRLARERLVLPAAKASSIQIPPPEHLKQHHPFIGFQTRISYRSSITWIQHLCGL